MDKQILKGCTRAVIETDEENPVTIADITSDEIKLADGYRIRLTLNYPYSRRVKQWIKQAISESVDEIKN